MPEFSQPTLGFVRQALERLLPETAYTPHDAKQFWKAKLFDAGFASEFINLASSGYSFNWTEIIPDLFANHFGDHNSHFGKASPQWFCEDNLKRLVRLAVTSSKDQALVNNIRQSLAADGFDISNSATGPDKKIPAGLEALPRKEVLLSDLKAQLERKTQRLSALFIDLDNFKAVNDQLGHDAGDRCLARVVNVMRDAVSGKGMLYRYGGDEFCALLPNFSIAEAATTAERIRAAIDTENPGDSMKVTCSIGVASSETDGLDRPEALLKAADGAMYVIKHTTKNGISVYPPSAAEKEAADAKRSNPEK